jgi:hypothetical protein
VPWPCSAKQLKRRIEAISSTTLVKRTDRSGEVRDPRVGGREQRGSPPQDQDDWAESIEQAMRLAAAGYSGGEVGVPFNQ